MFKINDIKHPSFEIADYIEFCALKNSDGTCSLAGLRAALSAPEDEIDISGTEEGDDAVLNKLSEALNRNSERNSIFGCYPFTINKNSLSCKNELTSKEAYYIFLLLANRLNMQTENVQGGLNATNLFERLCRCVTSEYLGRHCKCEVFGTSVNSSFEIKVNDILRKMDFPGHFEEPFGGTGRHKDGGIDIIAWIPFEDKKDSQLIALGQCKTGSNWEPLLKKTDFFSTYTTYTPYVNPIYFFFVTEDFGKYKWKERSTAAGVLFDRRRIIECIPADISSIDARLDADIHTWVTAALQYIRVNS